MKKILLLIIFMGTMNISLASYMPVASDLNKIDEQTNKFINLIDSGKIQKERLLEQLFLASYTNTLSQKNKYVVNVVINNILKYQTEVTNNLENNTRLAMFTGSNNERIHGAAPQEVDFKEGMDLNSIDKDKLYSKIVPYVRKNIAIRENNGARMVAYYVMGKESFQGFAKLYLWGVTQEYYEKDGQILKGSLISSPMVLYVKVESNEYVIYNHDIPNEGEAYQIGENKMFPQELSGIINERPFLQDLFSSVDSQSISYFSSN
ncbi:MAG: hypothetical protein V3575_02380 [Candidatus Absconditabacteria bacterium]